MLYMSMVTQYMQDHYGLNLIMKNVPSIVAGLGAIPGSWVDNQNHAGIKALWLEVIGNPAWKQELDNKIAGGIPPELSYNTLKQVEAYWLTLNPLNYSKAGEWTDASRSMVASWLQKRVSNQSERTTLTPSISMP